MGGVLECSSIGDKRFSAFNARIMFNGQLVSIESVYQGAKGFVKEPVKRKGAKPDFFIINGRQVPLKYGPIFYDVLWVMYLDEHPELVTFLKGFDDYNDRFKSKNAKVCQADSIRKYVKHGRASIVGSQEYEELLELLKK